MPNLYIIAGPNGAGKTTASYTVLPELLNCYQFVNADEIAKGISPFKPENASFEAGRIMLSQIKKNLNLKIDFAIETTLSTKSYLKLVKKAKSLGYTVTLLFFWLESVQIAKARVKRRVEQGGHNIDKEVIERRFIKGLKNLREFIKIVDNWIIMDNDYAASRVIADSFEKKTNIHFPEIFKTIIS